MQRFHPPHNAVRFRFGAGRGSSGVDLVWHPNKEFKKLPDDQKDELHEWIKTQKGKKIMKQSHKTAAAKRKSDFNNNNENSKNGDNWKKKTKKAMQTSQGLKSVTILLADEEQSNQSFVAVLVASPSTLDTTNNTPAPAPTGNTSILAAHPQQPVVGFV